MYQKSREREKERKENVWEIRKRTNLLMRLRSLIIRIGEVKTKIRLSNTILNTGIREHKK
jgi:hypothetical protein